MISKNLILEDNQSSGDVPTRLNYSYDKNYLIQSITMTQNEVQVGIIEYSYEYYWTQSIPQLPRLVLGHDEFFIITDML